MTNDKIYAVIIGIGNYQDPAISKLKYTHADAKAFADLLSDPNRCGIPAEQLKLLLDEEATCYNIKDIICDWLYYNAKEDSTVIIFFAGHGGSEHSRRAGGNEASEKYLLPWDTKIKNLYASAISCLSFNDLLDRVNVKRKVIFMDACYSGGVAKPGGRDLTIVENPYSNLGEGHGTVVVAASQPHQKSWELDQIGHGIFTYHLIEALKGEADTDRNGEITVWEVIDYLKKHVPLSAQKFLKEAQVPYWRGEGSGDIRLTINSKILEELRLKQDKDYQDKRIKILNLYQRIPQKYIDEALELIKKDKASLNADEADIIKFLELLLKEDISVEQYLRFHEALFFKEKKVKEKTIHQENISSSRTFEGSKKVNLKYCIKCGTQIVPNTKFCISCGEKLPFN